MNYNRDSDSLDNNQAATICAIYPDQVKIMEKPIFEDHYAFAVSVVNTELANWINETIAEMKENGEWKRITEKYFGSTDQE